MNFHIRPIRPQESADFLELRKKTSEESNFLLFSKVEIEKLSEFMQTKLLEETSQHTRAVFVAEAESKLVAYLSISKLLPLKQSHICNMYLAVLRDYQSLGIATSLIYEAQAWGEQNHAQRLELLVNSENHHALKLYLKCGFTIEGTRKSSIYQEDGKICDEIYMSKLLNQTIRANVPIASQEVWVSSLKST